jgi:hypothetical protein
VKWTPGQVVAAVLAVSWGIAASINDNAADAALIVIVGICCLAGAC